MSRTVDKEMYDERIALVNQGLSDGECAKILHIERSSFCQWRRYHGIAPNIPKGFQKGNLNGRQTQKVCSSY